MAHIHVGLALWHKHLLKEVDRVADSIKNDYWHQFAYPQEFSCVELQLDGPTVFFRHIGKQFDAGYFDSCRRDERILYFRSMRGKNGGVSHKASLEHAVDSTLAALRSRPVLGMHSSGGVYDPRLKAVIPCDLSEPDGGLRSLSLQKTKNLMVLAGSLDADYFVLHPSAYRNWLGDLGHRKERISVFYDSFTSLMSFYRSRDFRFKMVPENLEFDKFPATAEELADMHRVCGDIAEHEGVGRHNVAVCLDLQHLRHSLKIINESSNYPRYSHTRGIDGLLQGFGNVHRKFLGHSYNWCWKGGKHDRYDIFHDFLDHHADDVRVVHVAGNDEGSSCTHGPIRYKDPGAHIPFYVLNLRAAVNSLMDHGFDGAVVIEDQSGGISDHVHSGLTMQRYIQERLGR